MDGVCALNVKHTVGMRGLGRERERECVRGRSTTNNKTFQFNVALNKSNS